MAGMQLTRIARSLLVASLLVLLGSGVLLAARQAVPQAPPQGQALVQQAPPAKDAVPGVRNFTKVDATIACGGALSPEAFAGLKQAGFASIVNLRAASEAGVNVEDEQKAAQEAGLKYYHLPFVTATPDTAKIDEFLKLVAAPENQPMMLHCASGGRASVFWAVKRVMIDGWPVEKAMNELPELSKNVSEPLRKVALDYLKAHGKGRP